MKEIKSLQNENEVVFTRITAAQSNEKYGLKFPVDWHLKHSCPKSWIER
jgi:hypothetical protein